MYPRIPPSHIQVLNELEKFQDHIITVFRLAIPAGIAAAFSPHPGLSSMALCLGVVLSLIAVGPHFWPTILDDLRRRGQGKLAEDARQTILGTPDNQRMALLGGLALTGGMWVEAVRGFYQG
jgi:hypothetical protein